MILFSLLIFFTFFFLSLSMVRPRKEKDEVAERLQRLLEDAADNPEKNRRLEKRERLSDLPLFNRILEKIAWTHKFHNWVRQSGLPFSPGALILISLLLGSTAFLSLSLLRAERVFELLVVCFCAMTPFLGVAFVRKRRFKRFSDTFPEAVSRMASSLRAGYSLQMAFEAVREDSGNLVAEEFGKVLAEIELGQSFEEALKRMLERIDTPELRLFISAVMIQKESGGNLTELLDNLETTIRERLQLQRELDAATSQARFSGTILSFLPLVVGVFVFCIHRNYILFLFEDPVGKKLLWMSVAGQIMGFITIHKIVHIRM